MKLKKILLTCLLLFLSISSFSMISFSQTTDGQKTKMGVEYYSGNVGRDKKSDDSPLKPAGGNKLSSMLPSTGEEAVEFLVILGSVLLIFSGMYYIKKWYQAFKA